LRRFILPPELISVPPGGVIATDVLIAGAGLAGLYAALQLDPSLQCIMLTKEGVQSSNSWLAQGGIAAAIDTKNDDADVHMHDTMEAGAGLCDPDAVRVLVDEGPSDIDTLCAMNVPFDLDEEGGLSITREGGHTRRRVVHAGGDATGRETVKVLTSLIEACPNLEFMQHAFLLDILTDEHNAVCGAMVYNDDYIRIDAPIIIISTGGAGQMFHNTTNPSVATGDGLAAALRAGAKTQHMELVQFHPTALYTPGDKAHTPSSSRFLISEALRGEGAILTDAMGIRFMPDFHPNAELAPRDVVSRAIKQTMERTNFPHVYLDITSRGRGYCETRFPTIARHCAKLGYNLSVEPIPVVPAQHYMIGGIATDLQARTNIEGLYACGEVANVGVHGANRLASNSMLECLVFSRRAAQDIDSLPRPITRGACNIDSAPESPPTHQMPKSAAVMKRAIRDICEQNAGITRTKAGLTRGCHQIDGIVKQLDRAKLHDKATWECYNMAITAQQVLHSALARRKSVGVHYRVD